MIELDPARVEEAEIERYGLYCEIWCKDFRDIRNDSAVAICVPSEKPRELGNGEAVPLARS